MKVRVLGCSGGIGAGLRTTSLLLDDDILIDAGTGLGDLPLDQMASLRHIFLTHSHFDHIAGLPLLLDSIFDRIKTPITLHAQPVTIQALRDHMFNWVLWPDFTVLPSEQNGVLRFAEMRPGEVMELGGRQLEMIPVNHAVPTVAYRVASNGKSFAFSGDTTTNDTLWAALNRHETLDLLIVEAAFPNRDKALSIQARHYTPDLLAADLRKLQHRPKLYITHPKPGAEALILEECRSAIDGHDPELLSHGQHFQL